MLGADLVDAAVALVTEWLQQAEVSATSGDRRTTEQLRDIVEDPHGVEFTMRFVDRVLRPDSDVVAARQFSDLLAAGETPAFLGAVDRLLLKAGGVFATVLPALVMPLARIRMRSLVGHLVVDADAGSLTGHLSSLEAEGFAHNINLLGEAVLGESEAARRVAATVALLERPGIGYVSVKLSGIVPQLNYWDWEGSVERSCERVRTVLDAAIRQGASAFVNFDMEEYHDQELTVAAVCRVLNEEPYKYLDVGMVLQTYLPDSFGVLQRLAEWSSQRRAAGGGEIKVRLVKGANLAMESVDAEEHGWALAPYSSKHETDANFKRCVDWALTPEHMSGMRIGIASHNLFDVAWALLLSRSRGVSDRVEFEMLQGMAQAHARVVREETEDLLLYTPVVDSSDFDVAISYLFRRLEENATDGNFMRALFSLEPGTEAFDGEAAKFRAAVASRWEVGDLPNRNQERPATAAVASGGDADGQPGPFVNEPDTDPALASNRAWASRTLESDPGVVNAPIWTSTEQVDQAISEARASGWPGLPSSERRRVLHRVADELAKRRGDLVAAMAHEGNKTFAQADPEVSEAVDFARYYGDRAVDLDRWEDVVFAPLGVVAVITPWNFPVAIVAGGVLAGLAAGNTVLLKPAPETPRCAEIVAECCWTAGVPRAALQFMRVPEDEVGKHLITQADGVILTGGLDTARLFQSWDPQMKLFAETSGKNSLVVTPNADIDLAVKDLVSSAFGHSGQKCSAASLAILVGDVYASERFRRQLVDAVESLVLGESTVTNTTLGPTIGRASATLRRGLTEIENGETWLVEPRQLPAPSQGELWSPGVRLGVTAGSWYHRNECFGPVLGLMRAEDLDEAIALQNSSAFGLTGGIHSLDPKEVDRWADEVEVGNAYVNRAVTGAIVQRQPFGGWKLSSVGPGAKAGGPNYVAQLGTWMPVDEVDPATAAKSDAEAWSSEFSIEHDPTGLASESNVFRYRRLPRAAIWVGPEAVPAEYERVRLAAKASGVPVIESGSDAETEATFLYRVAGLGVRRVRVVGRASDGFHAAANAADIYLATDPVTNNGFTSAVQSRSGAACRSAPRGPRPARR